MLFRKSNREALDEHADRTLAVSLYIYANSISTLVTNIRNNRGLAISFEYFFKVTAFCILCFINTTYK